MRIRWTRKASLNLEDVEAYIARDDPQAALRTVIRIIVAVGQLAEHPEIGRVGRVQGTRELVVPGTPYIVPYRVRNRAVEILRVLHAARKWPNRF